MIEGMGLAMEDRYRIYNIVHPFLWDYVEQLDEGQSILVDIELQNCSNFKMENKSEEECRDFLRKKYISAVKRVSGDDSDDEDDDYGFDDEELDEYCQYNIFKDVRQDCEDDESNVLIVTTGLRGEMHVDTYNLKKEFLVNGYNYMECEIKEIDKARGEKWAEIIERFNFFNEDNVRKIMLKTEVVESDDAVLLLVGTLGQSTIFCSTLSHENVLNSLKRWLVHPDKVKNYITAYNNRGNNKIAICAFCEYCRHNFIVRSIDINAEEEPPQEPRELRKASNTTATIFRRKKLTVKKDEEETEAQRKLQAYIRALAGLDNSDSDNSDEDVSDMSDEEDEVVEVKPKRGRPRKTVSKAASKAVKKIDSDDESSEEEVVVKPKRATTRKTATKKAATTRKTATKTAAKKATTRKTATKTAAKKATTRKTATKTATKKAATTRKTATKTATKKAATRKTATKKATPKTKQTDDTEIESPAKAPVKRGRGRPRTVNK